MINVYNGKSTDFSTLGLAALEPIECTVTESAGGQFEMTMVHPIDDALKWTYLQVGNVIKAPCATRQTPLIKITDNVPVGTTTTKTRSIYKVQTTTGQRLHLRAKPSLSAKIIRAYKCGTQVVRLSTSGDWARVVVCSGGATGWMWKDDLKFVKSQTETVTGSSTVEVVSKTIEASQTREQLFRIYSVEPDTSNNTVTVLASHIFYDLQGIICTAEYEPENVPANTVLNALLANLSSEHDFTFYCTVDSPVSGEYTGVSLVKALLDPDIGIVAQTGARIIRDNFDVFIVPDEVLDRGMEIRHRKNLVGATMTTDISEAVTRIRPVGKTKKDERLLITDNGGWVDSPNKGSYPTPRDTEVSYDVKVGSGDGEFKTEALARAELKRLAEQDFTNGADAAAVSMDVQFIALENLKEYADYAPMLALYLYDTVRIIAAYAGINAKIRVNGYTFDCLLKRYDSIQLGQITDIEQTTYGYEIASGSVSGTKIMPNTVDGNTVMRRASIGYAKIDQAAIDQLAANSITAVRADIHTIVAQSTTTDELYADLAKIATVTITTADIDWASIKDLTAEVAKIADAQISTATITTAQVKDLNAAIAAIADAQIASASIKSAQIDDLSAVIAKAIHSEAETGTFTLAEIKNLVANALILKEGIADSMMITNLSVTSANLLNATVDKLVLKGSDSKYYHVFVGTDGVITTEETTPTQEEIDAGETSDGRLITETTANVAELNTQTVKAKQAVLETIFVETLTAGKITANEALISSATIPELYATSLTAIGDTIDISANKSITLALGEAETASKAAETAKTNADNALAEITETKQTVTEIKDATATIQTQLDLTNSGLSLVQTTTENLEGRVQTIESGVHISGSEIGIYSSDSPYRNTITNDGWKITENGSPVITCAETKLTAPRVQVTDALIIGDLAWKPSSDKHLRLLKYGR